MNSTNKSISSAQALFAIDGVKIRTIRESQKLTQLYVATSLGITVDTVSRWENGRSPNIKLENAEKLAEVLAISLDEIAGEVEPDKAEKQTASSTAPPAPELVQTPQSPGETGDPEGGRTRHIGRLISLALVVAMVVLVLLWWRSNPSSLPLTAQRLLPRYASPQQPFPVIIEVNCPADKPLSLVVKEYLPRGSRLLAAVPSFFASNSASGQIKWLSQSSGSAKRFFAYLVQPSAVNKPGDRLRFVGEVTGKALAAGPLTIGGANEVVISASHWADSNGDGVIDDEEILTIYNSFAIFEKLGINLDEIQQIWASKGYRWDEEKNAYVGIR